MRPQRYRHHHAYIQCMSQCARIRCNSSSCGFSSRRRRARHNRFPLPCSFSYRGYVRRKSCRLFSGFEDLCIEITLRRIFLLFNVSMHRNLSLCLYFIHFLKIIVHIYVSQVSWLIYWFSFPSNRTKSIINRYISLLLLLMLTILFLFWEGCLHGFVIRF